MTIHRILWKINLNNHHYHFKNRKLIPASNRAAMSNFSASRGNSSQPQFKNQDFAEETLREPRRSRDLAEESIVNSQKERSLHLNSNDLVPSQIRHPPKNQNSTMPNHDQVSRNDVGHKPRLDDKKGNNQERKNGTSSHESIPDSCFQFSKDDFLSTTKYTAVVVQNVDKGVYWVHRERDAEMVRYLFFRRKCIFK